MSRPEVESVDKRSSLPATKEQAADIEPIVVEVEKIPITVEQIRKYIAPQATQQELFMFAGICRSLGLNPFKREIYFVKYGSDRASVIVGYEVYLKRAERSGKLDGWSVTIDRDQFGEKAVCTIKRKDWSEPFLWEIYREEYDKGPSKSGKDTPWTLMPYTMLKKVAIAQAMRLCFPDELGGLPYIREEQAYSTLEDYAESTPMELEAGDIPEIESVEKVREGRPDQNDYFAMAKEVFKNDKDRKQWQKDMVGKESTADWTTEDYDRAFELLNHLDFENEALKKAHAELNKKKTDSQNQPAEPEPETVEAEATVLIEQFQIGEIKELVAQTTYKSLGSKEFRAWWTKFLGVKSTTSLPTITYEQAEELIKALQALAMPVPDDEAGQDELL